MSSSGCNISNHNLVTPKKSRQHSSKRRLRRLAFSRVPMAYHAYQNQPLPPSLFHPKHLAAKTIPVSDHTLFLTHPHPLLPPPHPNPSTNNRTPTPRKHRTQLPRRPRDHLHRQRQHPTQTTRHILRRELIQQALDRSRIPCQLPATDRAAKRAQGVEVPEPGVPAEQHGVREVLREDLGADVQVRVRADAVVPVGRDLLGDVGPAAVAVGDGAEEGGDGREVGGPGGAEGGEELVEEGGRAVEEERLGAVVEVAVLGFRLRVALRAVEREAGAVEGAVAGGVHVAEQRAVERVVVAGEVVVVAREGGVAFEFLWGRESV